MSQRPAFTRSLLAALLLLPLTGAGQAPKVDSETRGIMNTIFAPLSKVLPMSFDQKTFTAEANRKEIAAELAKLRDNAGALDKHAQGKDRAFEYVAKSLQRDARGAYRWYQMGRFDEARFTLQNMTENCIACHSNLPETHKVPPAESFLKNVKLDSLPVLEQAHLLVMSRQFDDALATYEKLFAGKDVHPMNLVVLGAFTDYLKVSIAVKSDLTRPQATLVALRDKSVTPVHVKEQVERWLKALKEFDSQKVLEKGDLAAARKIVNDARAVMDFPRDRDGLIHSVVASAILTRYVHARQDKGRDVAEAYYLLGQSESLLEHSLWIQRSDFYFETAIRLAPDADFAPKAYAKLEESYINGYTGSAGTNLPGDVKDLLMELRKVIEEARGKKT